MGSLHRPLRWLVVLLFCASPAKAYRPFDGTDADVAKPGEFELELGPSQYQVRGGRRSIAAPAVVLNFGLGAQTELVVDLQNSIALGRDQDSRLQLRNTDLLLKHVLREGRLQGETGPSVAVEGGLLAPEVNGQRSFGAGLNLIVSYEWWFGTVHFNEQGQYTRAHRPDVFSSVILEGPHEWHVRPVTELYYEREFGAAETWSVLSGAIWTVRDSLALDLGLRHALVANVLVEEARLGFTWAFPM